VERRRRGSEHVLVLGLGGRGSGAGYGMRSRCLLDWSLESQRSRFSERADWLGRLAAFGNMWRSIYFQGDATSGSRRDFAEQFEARLGNTPIIPCPRGSRMCQMAFGECDKSSFAGTREIPATGQITNIKARLSRLGPNRNRRFSEFFFSTASR
jgi:hypothetical protein